MMTTTETITNIEFTEENSLESVASAMKEGAADANKAASIVLPVIGKILSKTVYNGCYYISFGVTFSALTVGRLLPRDNVAGRGLHDGVLAAKEKVSRRAELPEAESADIEIAAEQTEAGTYT
jgi:hypothetical protein